MDLDTKIPKISKQIYKEDTFNAIENNFLNIAVKWTTHQMEWSNDIYQSFKDHDKFLIILYLLKKTLDFYSINFIKLTYDEFYKKDFIEIEKFNVIEISDALKIPKESARRKIIELEKVGVIKRFKKKIIIDRSSFPFVKPLKTVKQMSRFLAVLSKILVEENILLKSFSSDTLEETIKSNFSYIWKLYYELQIPMVLNYKKIFKDLETWHIWGSCGANQFYSQKLLTDNTRKNRESFYKTFFNTNKKVKGINAMSISDITGIPRATVIRKLKILVKNNYLRIDNKKTYKFGIGTKKLIPLQVLVINNLSNFSTKIYNLILVN